MREDWAGGFKKTPRPWQKRRGVPTSWTRQRYGCLPSVTLSGLNVLAIRGMLAFHMDMLDMGMFDFDMLAVLECMLFRRVISVADGVQLVAMGKVSMVARCRVIAIFGMLGRMAVVSRCMFEVLGGFMMVLMDLVFVLHRDSPELVVGRLMPGSVEGWINRSTKPSPRM
jgi:hypothetical protein